MRESFRKDFNLTALKEWKEAGEPFEEDEEILAYLEYKKNEARKNGTDSANSGSADGVTRQGSNGTGGRSSVNGDKQKIGNMYGIHPNNNQKTKKESPSPASRTRKQSITTTYKNDKCSGKKQNQTEFPSQSMFLTEMLNSLRTLDLLDFYIKRNLEVNIRKFAEVLPEWHRLMLWYIRGQLFRAIAFYDNHDEYVEFLDIFYSNYKSSI
ncbi:hypothetical protein C1646_776613 [Rhizophagus diaphanus]|nr:hypothetical protein C1646_776613 [Rhizophagus diaphanus] [Rhizophagus sp. MUCL 43196]